MRSLLTCRISWVCMDFFPWQEKMHDFVVATNEVHSVREFVEESFKYIGVDIM